MRLTFFVGTFVSNVINSAFSRSEAYNQTITGLIDTIFVNPGTPFKVIVWLGTMIALIGVAYFFTQWSQSLQRGEGFPKIFTVILSAWMFANHGAAIAQMAKESLNIAWTIDARVLNITVSEDGTIGEVIQASKLQEAAKQTVALRQRECLGKQSPQEITLCQQKEVAAIQREFEKQEVAEPGYIASLWNDFTSIIPSTDLNLIPDLNIGSALETAVSFLLGALAVCWSMFFDMALILTALMLPIAIGISMFSSSALIDWVSGMGGLILTKISLLITWSIVSAISLAQPSISSVAIAILTALFSPILAI